MKRLILFFLIVTTHSGVSQTKIYTQQEVNQFVENELTRENTGTLKKMLLSNKKLQGWSKYYSV